ncbi:MAG: zf-HC2 domain-containing protein [Candidatus Marinimicrobia bacterium]|nr:zf-HC2 domain-containing protein [Candidatus Neomarinimicrobiota bacterium]
MISCYQFKTIISQYIDQDIPFQKRKSFEEHMASCSGCKALYRSIVNTKSCMNSFQEITVSDSFLASLQNKILAERNARIEASISKGFSLNRIPSFAYGFAAVLIAVVIGFYLVEFQPGSQSPQIPPKIVQEKIQTNPSLPNHNRPIAPRTSQQQLANSESIIDSLTGSDAQNAQTNPNFQNKIKTVNKEY